MIVHTSDPSVVEIARIAFPGYNGRKFKVKVTDTPVGLKSYWDEGSRSLHVLVNLETRKTIEVPQNGTMFDKQVINNDKFPCPGIAVVTNTIFRGKDLGITISIHPNNANEIALPEKIKLNKNELIVLYATVSLKSSYGGVKNLRFVEAKYGTGITEPEWFTAVNSLIEKGLLNKRNAITNDGKNAFSQYGINSFYQLKNYEEKE